MTGKAIMFALITLNDCIILRLHSLAEILPYITFIKPLLIKAGTFDYHYQFVLFLRNTHVQHNEIYYEQKVSSNFIFIDRRRGIFHI